MTIDITPEAVERLADQAGFMCRDGFKNSDDIRWQTYGAFESTLRALSAALTASQAETAAAYEVAAETYVKGDWDWFSDADDAIRALTPDDSKAALDRMIADARADGMREAAAWQPIETAPRDGTKFDVWFSSVFGGYRKCNFYFNTKGKLRHNGILTPAELQRWPTHWMPLPLPPKGKDHE